MSFLKVLKRILYISGIDKAIMFTTSASFIGAFGSILSLILVVRYLNAIEQGVYFTFTSIIAIQVFFELGLNGIIVQFVAHEMPNLILSTKKNDLKGHEQNISRLSSLLHFVVKWYLSFSILLFILLIIVGLIFFTKYVQNTSISWVFPWLFLSLATSLNLLVSPIISFLQGMGQVKEIAKSQLVNQLVKLIFVSILLIFNGKLYSLGLSSLIAVFFSIYIIWGYKSILLQIWKIEVKEKINYRIEIFPYQWKIGLSWISGYFIFQLFNPVLFATSGAIIAGQMGMTLTVLNGILALSFSWMTTKVPLFSKLIAQKDYSNLDLVFNRTLNQSSLINFGLLSIFLILIFLARKFNLKIGPKLVGDRFLDYIPLLLLMITFFLNHIVGSLGIYLRCHKKEPFLINSIVAAVLCSLSIFIFGRKFGVLGVTLGYSLIIISIFPWSYYVFKTKKREWHNS